MYFAIVSVDASPVEQTKYPDDQNTCFCQKCFLNSVLCENHTRAVVVCFNNRTINILRVGQTDCYGEEIKSQATGDLELKIPRALQKMTSKIERSGICLSVGHGSGQAARSLVVQ